MKRMNKVIAAMMIMAITSAVPAMAKNKKHMNDDRVKVVVVDNHSRYDKAYNHRHHAAQYRGHAHRHYVKACTFRVSPQAVRHHALRRAEHLRGVVDVKWNPYTCEMTVFYDTRLTTARHIMHHVA